MPPGDPRDLLPLKPLVFDILVVLAAGEQHGWGLLRALEARLGTTMLPGRLYRQLDAMLRAGLIGEQSAADMSRPPRPDGTGGAEARRFFQLTALGRRAARAEARRLASLVDELRAKRLLPQKGRP
jgi:DNA-binding PadR family transcriptional regulator